MEYKTIQISELIGKTFASVIRSDSRNDDYIMLYGTDGTVYKMYHDQSCCESVRIEDICGDLSDLVDAEIYDAREDKKEKDTRNGIEGV